MIKSQLTVRWLSAYGYTGVSLYKHNGVYKRQSGGMTKTALKGEANRGSLDKVW